MTLYYDYAFIAHCFFRKAGSSGSIQPLAASTAAPLDEAVTVDVVCGPTAAAFFDWIFGATYVTMVALLQLFFHASINISQESTAKPCRSWNHMLISDMTDVRPQRYKKTVSIQHSAPCQVTVFTEQCYIHYKQMCHSHNQNKESVAMAKVIISVTPCLYQPRRLIQLQWYRLTPEPATLEDAWTPSGSVFRFIAWHSGLSRFIHSIM